MSILENYEITPIKEYFHERLSTLGSFDPAEPWVQPFFMKLAKLSEQCSLLPSGVVVFPAYGCETSNNEGLHFVFSCEVEAVKELRKLVRSMSESATVEDRDDLELNFFKGYDGAY